MKRKKSALKNIVGTVVHNKRKIPNREKAKEREREREKRADAGTHILIVKLSTVSAG